MGTSKHRLWIKLKKMRKKKNKKKHIHPIKQNEDASSTKKQIFFLRTNRVGARSQISRRLGSNSASRHPREIAISTKIGDKDQLFTNLNPKAYKIRRKKRKKLKIYRFTQADRSRHQDHPELHKFPAIKQPHRSGNGTHGLIHAPKSNKSSNPMRKGV